MAFEKGHPGGPGRPKGSGRNKRCEAWAKAYGLKFLEDVAEGKITYRNAKGKLIPVNVYARIDVVKYLVDQGIGKATQHHEVGFDGESESILGFIASATKDAKMAGIYPDGPKGLGTEGVQH